MLCEPWKLIATWSEVQVTVWNLQLASEVGEVHGTEPSTCRVFANPVILVRIELT